MTSPSPTFKADILVIDDTPENLTLLNAMLTKQGYKVRSVTKGLTGLRGAQSAPPDLILLDVSMPVMSGYEVCEQLKADDRTRDIPVIFISAMGDVDDKVQAFQVGGVDYITKPFQVAEVLARIETHLTIRQLQQQLQTQNQRLSEEIYQRERAEETFTTIFRSSSNPMALATLDTGQLLDVNPSFMEMSGLKRDRILNRPLSDLFWGANRNAISETLTALATTTSFQHQELEFRTSGESSRIMLVSMERIEVNQQTCVLLIANDITERKQLENEFISLVSHELRTPLTALMGSLDILNSGQLGELNSYGQRILTIATTNTERLIRLINDILDLERIQAGVIIMQRQTCDIAELCVQAVESVQELADSAQIQLTTQVAPLTIEVDPDRLLQTLTNLLGNAIKFSEAGHQVTLSATLHTTSECQARWQAEIGEIEAPHSLLIRVEDQGRGIPAEKIATIFERFYQVNASDAREKGGTGLGLSICRSIVQQHEGRIWVESQVNQGSTFYVLLPQAQIPASIET